MNENRIPFRLWHILQVQFSPDIFSSLKGEITFQYTFMTRINEWKYSLSKQRFSPIVITYTTHNVQQTMSIIFDYKLLNVSWK